MKSNTIYILILAIVSFMVATPVCSAFDDVSDKTLVDSIGILQSFGIINGYSDNTFKPEVNITRAEFCKIVSTFKGIAANKPETQKNFPDVQNDYWGADYILLAYEAGIINGFPDGSFMPENNITYEQAIKMIVEALDYGYFAQQAGGYPNGYMQVAIEEKITKEIVFEQSEPATRGNIALMIRNALNIPILSPSGAVDEQGAPIKMEITLYDIYSATLQTEAAPEYELPYAEDIDTELSPAEDDSEITDTANNDNSVG